MHRQAYDTALSETRKTITSDRLCAHEQVKSALAEFILTGATLDAVATEIGESEAALENFLMRFHHQMPESSSTASRAYVSALTIASGYFFGGLFPLLPYFFASNNHIAFSWSVAIMVVVLFAFGYVKTLLVGEGSRSTCLKSGVQMVFCGGVAAAAAIGCINAISGIGG